ncbi:T9SS sorting signal type C domain-containing protein [Flavobacterium sp. LS1R49]|uniref:T9SS sorting signal type C domain-containing protein n=1 Tax=Flavobacterium shii TaxID=2987687 RepID=A0A9X2YV65_9FLAO|nr:T9SS sorting signal type C domain-containing protein [Flavobacterium shii]MCV9927904.1 T9SS sorting signal type C domain-containing protein [Flavobacterium shii]
MRNPYNLSSKPILREKKKTMRKDIFFPITTKFIITLIFIFSIPKTVVSQVITNSYTTNQVFTVPIGVTSLKVECWGGGGKGSNIINAVDTGGGGGGGAYATSLICVTPGEAYNIAIGSGGTGTTANGGDSYFGNAALVMAKGGSGLTENIITAAPGGLASASVGQTKYSGGNGSPRSSYTIIIALAYRSGAGGGGAGSIGAGNNAVETTAGAARVDNGGTGGTGTDGGLLSLLGGFNGNPGSNYGGGGSGAGRGLLLAQQFYTGGNGAPGLVRISYEQYACQATLETTWNGSAWSNGDPQGCKKAIINGDYNTTTNGSFTACSCQVNAGKKLTVGNAINTDYVNVYNQLENNGTVIINNNASLVQQYSVKNNSGNISIHRHTQPMYRFDYTYWSSPVTYDSNFTLNNLVPNTLPDKYHSWNAITQSWDVNMNGTEIMIPGKGYIIRAPYTFSWDPSEVVPYEDGIFIGKPNNGTINYNIMGSTAEDKWNLVGNPYPSAIDIEQFLLLNNTKLDGTAYLWTHNSPISATGNYTASDYAAYNFTGAIRTANKMDNTTLITKTPTKYFASGQSFLVRGISNGAATITFSNAMRVNNFNHLFFKPNKANSAEDGATAEKNRIWLNLTNNEGAFNQTLIGYIENATNEIDWGYDGDFFGGNYVSFYSIADTRELSIQGRALPFNNEDIVPLGYKTTLIGDLKIGIDNLDGLMSNKAIYLEDKVLNIIHDLRVSDYTFTTIEGTFNDRFVLRYTNKTLNIPKTGNPENCIVYKNDSQHIVVNSGVSDIKQIKIYDISGKLIYETKNVNGTIANIENLPPINQVLLVNVLTAEGLDYTNKIIF